MSSSKFFNSRFELKITSVGCSISFLSFLLLLCIFILMVHPFLAVSETVDSHFLVLEGWLPDYALGYALDDFYKYGYQVLITLGTPLSQGSYLAEYQNYADLAAATLRKLSGDSLSVITVSTQNVLTDRTYEIAMALKARFHEYKIPVKAINVYTLGAHARRTRLIFSKVFKNELEIGIISIKDKSYDARKWWRSSQGVRIVLSETIAYIYAKFFFYP